MSEETATATATAEQAVNVGDLVITVYDDEPVEWGGAPDGYPTLKFGLFSGAKPVRRCDPKHVAPADVKIPEKDSRVTVVKLSKAQAPYHAQGVWALSVTGMGGRSWHRTKRDGTATGLRRCAIADWHADQEEAAKA